MSTAPARIYIVEDEALIALELEDRLKQLGYDVCGSARRGETAQKEIPETEPDLVLMDIQLAGEMNGIEVAGAVRDRSDAAVIYLSAYSDDALVERAVGTDPYGYLLKPFNERELHTTIQAALKKRAQHVAISAANERIWDRSIVAMFRADPAGSFLAANDAAVRLHGYASEEELLRAMREDAREIYVDEQDRRHILDTLDKHGVVRQFETRIHRHRSGEELWVLQDLWLVRDDNDEPLFVEGFVVDISKRKHAEEALRELNATLEQRVAARTQDLADSELRFRTIANSSPALTFITRKADNTVLFINDEVRRRFGKDADKYFIGADVSRFYTDDTVRPAIIRRLENGEQIRNQEISSIGPDGAPYTLLCSYALVTFGDEPCVLSTFLDITEEKATRERTDQFMAAIELLPDGIALFDAGDRLVAMNRSYRDFDKLDQDPIQIGQTFRETLTEVTDLVGVPDGFRDVDAWIAWRMERHRHPIEPFEIRRGPRWVRVAERRLPEHGTVVLVSDITKRIQDEERLRASEERLRQATQLAGLGFWIWDAETDRCTYCSEENARIHGLTVQEYIDNASALDGEFGMVHPDDRETVRDRFRALREGESFDIEYRLLTSTGDVRHVREIAVPVRDAGGKVVRERGSVLDLTDIKRTEERLREAQKMEAVGQLTGGLAHDFNNFIGVVIGNLDLLAETNADDPQATRYIDTAISASQRAADLTKSLLAFSRRQPLHPRLIDLNDRLRGVGPLVQRTLGGTIDLVTRYSADLWLVRIDVAQFDSCIVNLANNAHDAMPDGGSWTIATHNRHFEEADEKPDDDIEPGDYVLVEVSDTGHGIPAELISQVFEPFFTTKGLGHGTGLGLSMVYGFVKQSGGHIRIYSEVDYGTTIRIYLPRAAEPKTVPQATTDLPQALPNGDESILVVEDDDDMRATASAGLRSLGYRVIEASDGDEALDIVERRAAEIDLLFSDVVMPGSLTGYELARRVRDQYPSIRVLLTSGFPGDTLQRKGADLGDIALLGKPYHKEALARKIRQTLDRSAADLG